MDDVLNILSGFVRIGSGIVFLTVDKQTGDEEWDSKYNMSSLHKLKKKNKTIEIYFRNEVHHST